jgi:hypothetical protein
LRLLALAAKIPPPPAWRNKFAFGCTGVEKGRHTGTMGKLNNDRVPSETLAYATAPGLRPSEAGQCVMSVCLWGDTPKRFDCRSAKNGSPLLAMALDVIRTSGGLPGTEQQDLLSASFPDIKSGLLSARRIQWALEGLAEYDPYKSAMASVLVDYEDGLARPGGALNREWALGLDRQTGSRGKIFLSQRVSEAVEGLPSLSWEDSPLAGFRSWTWKAAQPPASFAADEQAVMGMIQAAGRSDPVLLTSPRPLPPSPPTGPAHDFSPVSNPTLGRPDPPSYAAESPSAGKSLRIPILAGSAAVVVIGAALVFLLGHKTPPQNGTPAQGVTPAQSASPGSAPPAQAAAHPIKQGQSETHHKPSLLERLEPKKPVKEEPAVAPPPTVVEAHCDLTDEDIQRSLARADRYMHDGDLSNAKAAYLHVMGCPASKAKAQEGLSRIQKMAAQNGSPNP